MVVLRFDLLDCGCRLPGSRFALNKSALVLINRFEIVFLGKARGRCLYLAYRDDR
jgi:hypothetical protein